MQIKRIIILICALILRIFLPMKKITLGILGGGQLGRMSAIAAANLGISVHIFTPENGSPANDISAHTIVADYEDEEALSTFAENVDYISYEFENIPTKTINYLKKLKPVYPDSSLLEVSQDRIQEKTFLNSIGIETTRWQKYENFTSLQETIKTWDTNTAIIKTTRFGYDGKGQIKYTLNKTNENDIRALSGELIIEELVNFECEISVIIAKDAQNSVITYGPMLNQHKNHILDRTFVPAGIKPEVEKQALEMARNLAEKISLRGVLTVEFFVTKDGKVLANEIAPRTHNSGHWSIDACAHSQFENHVRAVCGLPVLPPARHSDAEMLNLIGHDVDQLDVYYKQENACVHLYGKHDVREGRKMGHVTFLKTKED